MLAFAAKVAHADTLCSQTDFSQDVDINSAGLATFPIVNTPFCGGSTSTTTIQSWTFYSSTPGKWISAWNSNKHLLDSFACLSAPTGNSPCTSGGTLGDAGDSITANGNFITIKYGTPATLGPGEYWDAQLQQNASGTHLGMTTSGLCQMRGTGGSPDQCGAFAPATSPYYVVNTILAPTSRTSITVVSPEQGTTTPSTTFNVDINYTVGSDLPSFSTNGTIPSRIGINITLLNVGTNQQINLGTDFAISSAEGSYSYSTTTTQSQSDYTLIATLVGDYGFIPPPVGCVAFPPFTNCEGTGNINTLATANEPTFSVDNGLFPILGFQVGSTTSRAGLATTTCSITAIGGCFQNALAFLFFPSPGILNQFSTLWSLIQNKPPFGYVSQTIIGLRSLNASSSPVFSFGDIPLVDTIFTPFRTGLAGLLWVGFFIAFYRGRLRHLDI